MPFPLPWFDNQPDPLLPSERNIKPFLYNYDDYQTYDILWYIPIKRNFYDLFYYSLNSYLPLYSSYLFDELPQGGAGLFEWFEFNIHPRHKPYPYVLKASDPTTLIFFDRFTPWDYPWAENYSTQLFNFLKKYCAYLIKTLDYFIPINLYTADNIPKFTSEYLPKISGSPPYKVKFSFELEQAQIAIFTWLDFEPSSLIEVIKRYEIFDLKPGKNQIELKINQYFCACSLVVSGSEELEKIEAEIGRVDKGLLYKNLDKLFKEISDFYPLNIIIGTGSSSSSSTYPPVSNVNQMPLPDWYYYANLTYANNNYWGNQININLSQDLGKPIFCVPVKNQSGEIIDIAFNLWGSYHLLLTTNYPGDSIAEMITNIPYTRKNLSFWKLIQTNLYKINGYANPEDEATLYEQDWFFTIFTEAEEEALSQNLERSLIEMGEALPREVVMSFIDARKRLELKENA
ncbi:MAG: hypothetical protein ACRC2V_19675 [Xenococcaceae cyanobacterium]